MSIRNHQPAEQEIHNDTADHDRMTTMALAEHLGVELWKVMEIARWAIKRQPAEQGYCECEKPEEDFTFGCHPNHCKFCGKPFKSLKPAECNHDWRHKDQYMVDKSSKGILICIKCKQEKPSQQEYCSHLYESDCHGIEMIKSPSGKEWAIGGTKTMDRWKYCPWCGKLLGKSLKPQQEFEPIKELMILYSTEPLEVMSKEFAIVGKLNELIRKVNDKHELDKLWIVVRRLVKKVEG